MANIPIFIPHSGCKNDCAFCNQRTITGKVSPPTYAGVEKIIEEHLSTLRGNGHTIAFFGGSFTGIGDAMEEYLKVAHRYVREKRVKDIRVSTRPDYISEDILNTLARYDVKYIELGAQSMDDGVLQAARRGHTALDVKRAARLICSRGITTGLQMMIGLPGDTYEKSIATAKSFVELGALEARIYPTVILKGTELCRMYEQGEYVPMSFEEAIDTAADCYRIFRHSGVKVLRIGLSASEELKKNAVGGFYHEAMGEIVYSRIILRSAMEHENIEIEYNKRCLSKVLGQQRCNIAAFEASGKSFKLIENNDLRGVKVNGKYVLTI